jgi:hypothetical protein
MTREDIIHMAEECGIPEFENNESQADNILRFATLVAEQDTALLRQALDCLENHVMQRTYAGGVVICNTAIALRERLALSDAALLAPKPGQLKDRGQE